jgi:hypothetical protein
MFCRLAAIDWTPESVSAAATIIIALFTAVLGVSTVFLWFATRRSARIAERALTELERPFVYGGVREPGFKIVSSSYQQGSELERGELELCIYNFGRTLARLTRIEYEISAAPHGGIAKAIDPKIVGGRELPVGTVCATGDPYCETTKLRLCFFDEANDIATGKKSVWIVGFVRYVDIFDTHHISGFTQVFDGIGGRFVRRGDQQYNYAYTEKFAEIPPPSSQGESSLRAEGEAIQSLL